MKILLTLFVLLFVNTSYAREVGDDIYDLLERDYKIVNVTTYNNKAVLYVLHKKNSYVFQCLVYIDGTQATCYTLDKR
tara:strand:- start:645 stop:878 length:234 start_codon:yes stop_codon:yes gene_type:complete